MVQIGLVGYLRRGANIGKYHSIQRMLKSSGKWLIAQWFGERNKERRKLFNAILEFIGEMFTN